MRQICYKLQFESVVDKLNSQPDLFTQDQSYYRQDKQTFNYWMFKIMQWVCTYLLMDPFEYCFMLHVLSKPEFDIIVIRDATQLQSALKFEYLIMYVGLHIKVTLNKWRNQNTLFLSG